MNQLPQILLPPIVTNNPQNNLFNLPQVLIPLNNLQNNLQMSLDQTHEKSENKIPITKKEITDLLTQDSYYRKIKQWPLLTFDEILPIKRSSNRRAEDIVYVSKSRIYYNDVFINCTTHNIDAVIDNINNNFPDIDKLLQRFKGNLVACGGAVVKGIFERLGGDIDLFFYDLTVEEADKMRIDAIEFLIKLWQENGNNEYLKFDVKRNEYTTTLYVDDDYGRFYEYQFIHRIYPNMSSIIGGFDISACMLAYDGKQIYATPLGAWSLKNKCIIIDTKRRSTSFEYRLRKYNRMGFDLIFPGISDTVVRNFIINNSLIDEMIIKIKQITKDYGYEYNGNVAEDFDRVGEGLPEYSRYGLQKKEDILPYFKLTTHGVYTTSYDHKNIEDKLINKISDYESLSSHPKCFPDINAQQLRCDNLHSVSSILKINTENNIKNQLYDDIENPNLMIDDDVISKFLSKSEKVRTPYKNPYYAYHQSYNNNIDFYRLLKCFGKLTPVVKEIRETDKYYEYMDVMINKMLTNAEICKKNLIGIKWITQNPGRQWTSSINPIFKDPREWYGKHYIPVITGIPLEIESTLRLMRLRESVWSLINDDVFNIICEHLLHCYADEAWQYIL